MSNSRNQNKVALIVVALIAIANLIAIVSPSAVRADANQSKVEHRRQQPLLPVTCTASETSGSDTVSYSCSPKYMNYGTKYFSEIQIVRSASGDRGTDLVYGVDRMNGELKLIKTVTYPVKSGSQSAAVSASKFEVVEGAAADAVVAQHAQQKSSATTIEVVRGSHQPKAARKTRTAAQAQKPRTEVARAVQAHNSESIHTAPDARISEQYVIKTRTVQQGDTISGLALGGKLDSAVSGKEQFDAMLALNANPDDLVVGQKIHYVDRRPTDAAVPITPPNSVPGDMQIDAVESARIPAHAVQDAGAQCPQCTYTAETCAQFATAPTAEQSDLQERFNALFASAKSLREENRVLQAQLALHRADPLNRAQAWMGISYGWKYGVAGMPLIALLLFVSKRWWIQRKNAKKYNSEARSFESHCGKLGGVVAELRGQLKGLREQTPAEVGVMRAEIARISAEKSTLELVNEKLLEQVEQLDLDLRLAHRTVGELPAEACQVDEDEVDIFSNTGAASVTESSAIFVELENSPLLSEQEMKDLLRDLEGVEQSVMADDESHEHLFTDDEDDIDAEPMQVASEQPDHSRLIDMAGLNGESAAEVQAQIHEISEPMERYFDYRTKDGSRYRLPGIYQLEDGKLVGRCPHVECRQYYNGCNVATFTKHLYQEHEGRPPEEYLVQSGEEVESSECAAVSAQMVVCQPAG